jgi:hypothetical protein
VTFATQIPVPSSCVTLPRARASWRISASGTSPDAPCNAVLTSSSIVAARWRRRRIHAVPSPDSTAQRTLVEPDPPGDPRPP